MNSQDIGNTGIKVGPGVGYITAHLVGVSLPDMVSVAVLVFTLLQIAYLIWKWRRAAKAKPEVDD